ncbi:MAG: peroxide stress protein YaaA [Gammaproteobacteria bacterium]|nr:MAG: peroxide stress protein YaaA [Gammaproteobacteria bacterium]
MQTQAKVVVFLPCCGSKHPSGRLLLQNTRGTFLPAESTEPLIQARTSYGFNLDQDSRLTSGFCLYTGSPYQAISSRHLVEEAILKNELRLFILSAGYGVLDAREPIHDYDEQMKGKVAKYWRDAGLVNVIEKIIETIKPSQVYGFFSGERYWSNPSSKYRYFFTESILQSVRHTDSIKSAGCFYRKEGRGVKAILNALGKAFNDCFACGFDPDFASETEISNRRYGNVFIGYDRFV